MSWRQLGWAWLRVERPWKSETWHVWVFITRHSWLFNFGSRHFDFSAFFLDSIYDQALASCCCFFIFAQTSKDGVVLLGEISRFFLNILHSWRRENCRVFSEFFQKLKFKSSMLKLSPRYDLVIENSKIFLLHFEVRLDR